MDSRYIYIALMLGLGPLAVSQPAAAVDCDIAVQLGDKPAMDDYADYSDFLVAIMDYKARDRELQAQHEACPELFVPHIDPASLDPTVTYGPETLDSAIARTARLHQTGLDNRLRSPGRTTSRNFGLPVLAPTQLEEETIPTPLRTLVEAPLSERDQRLVLNGLGPLPEDDGRWAAELQDRQLTDTLSDKEREVDLAFAFADRPWDYSYTLYGDRGNYITLYYRGPELVRVNSVSNSCMGCDLNASP